MSSLDQLMSYSPNYQTVWPVLYEKPEKHQLGDRVVFVNNHHRDYVFGNLGYVVGIYDNMVWVLFDRQMFGGLNLNNSVPEYRGGKCKAWDLFNLTRWKNCLIQKKETEQATEWESS